MRNYFKIWGDWIHVVNSHGPAFDSDLVGWGRTEQELEAMMQGFMAAARQTIVASGFTATFQRHPVVVYFELNKKNFVTLLNGWDSPGGKNAIWVWNGTALPKFSNFSDLYEDMTVFESPRKTWSDGH